MPKPGSGLQWRTSYTDGNSLPASAFGGSGGAEMCFKLDVLDPSAYTMQKQAGGGYLLQPRVAPAAAALPAPRAAPAAAAQPAGGEAGAAAEAAAAAPGKRNRRKRKREAAAAAAAAAPAPAPAPAAPAAAEAADDAGGGEEGGAGAGPDRKRKRKRPAAGAAAPSAASAAGEGGEGEGGAGAARQAQAPPQRAPPPPQPQQQQQQQQPRASALGPKDSAPALPSQDVAATWASFGPLRPELLANLARLRYGAPTAVQRSVLPEAITNFKDIVATAATGSGKTAAYALPLLQRLLDRREALGMAVAAPAQGAPPLPRWAALPALVLVPTRELALQVRDHVNALAAGTVVRAVAVVGGLAAQKQERLLRAHPDILVATPGRLAELMGSPHCAPFLSMDLSTLQLLVLDEADRMVDKGSFESLRVIFAALRGAKGASASASDKRGGGGGGGGGRGGEVDEIAEAIVRGVQEESARAAGRQGGGGEGGEGSGEEEEGEDEGGKAAGSSAAPATIPWRPSFKRQTFLFSATLGVATSAARAKDAALALVQAKAYAEGAGDEQGKLSGKGLKRALASVEGVSAVEALVAMCGCSGKPFVVRVGGGEGEGGGGSGGAAAPAGASGDGGGGTAAAAAFVGKAAARAAADRQPALPAAGSGEGSGEGSGGSSGSGSGSGAYHEDTTTAVHSTHAGERVSARALALPPGLRLGRVTCADMGEKECALYAFLQRYPGRTLVFLNSISGLKRLALLLTALRCPAFTLHAHMEQRARIKHLERFVAAAGSSGGGGAGGSGTSGTSVLLATDVAARGLDLPAVDAVIHFGLPLTAETFVHRSGRTARGPGGRGIALALVGPKDNAAYGRLCGALGMRSGLAEFPGEPGIARAVAARVAAARALAEVQGSLAADSAAQGWLVRQAEEMGVGLDEETVREVGGLGEVHLARQAAAAAAAAEAAGGEAAAAAGGGKRRKGGKREAVAEGAGEGAGEVEGGGGGGAQHAHTSEEDMALSRERRLKITHLKRVLQGLLAAPLIPTGTSRRYITGNPLLAQPMHPLQSTIRLAPAAAAGEGGGEGGGAGGAAAPAPAPVARSGSALVGLKVLPPLGFAAPVPQGKGGGKHRAPAAAQPDIFRRQGPLQALMVGGRHAHVPAAKIAARRAVSEHKRSGKGRK